VIGLSGRSTGRERDARGAGAVRRLAATAGLLLAGALLCPLTSAAATPADTAATHALLQARIEFDRAYLQDTPARQASIRRLASGIGRECHGVLSGEGAEPGTSGPPTPGSRRMQGESERRARQRTTIADELSSALSAAGDQASRAAIEAYAAATDSLSWSDPRIAPLVHANSAAALEIVTAGPADTCADMKAWAQSGYSLLSPASKAFAATRVARAEQRGAPDSLSVLLRPSESAAERAQLRLDSALRRKLTASDQSFVRIYSRLQRALGAPQSSFEERESKPVLGRGRTHSGETYTLRSGSEDESGNSSCRHPGWIELTESAAQNGRPSIGSGSSLCLSARGKSSLSTGCGEDVATVTLVVPHDIVSVRLRLSDGSTITSKVVRIPAKDGGPSGVYEQALRGYTPYPVSLAELDARAHVVRRLRLAPEGRCKKEADAGPKFVTLVSGQAPGGLRFTIQGVLVAFGQAQRAFNLSATLGAGGTHGEDSAESRLPKSFDWSLASECAPHPAALIYGILAAPGDSVLARTPEGLVPLAKLELAANLGADGPLVYGAFAAIPSELIVRRADGTTLYSESLAAKAAEETEYCEGLADG
jgi:hypothetical protein